MTLAAGAKVDVADITAMQAAWTSYTPTWTASTTNPTLGNGTITGAYLLIGKTCFFRIQLVMGSTTTYGSGPWSLSLPFTALTGVDQIVGGMALDASASAQYRGSGRIQTATSTITRSSFVDAASTTAGLNSLVPFTWTTSDALYFGGVYEIA